MSETEPETTTPETEMPETADEPDTQDEPETPDTQDEPDEADEPDTQDEPETEPVDEKEIEKAFKALGKLREHVASRVSAIMGEDSLQLLPCPTCQDIAPAFVWQPSVAPLSPEAEAATRQLLGMNVKGQFQPYPGATICETCQGLGSVETPSKVPGYDVVDCPNCHATGRILPNNVVALTPANGQLESAQVVTGPTVAPAQLSPEAEAAKAQGYMVIPPLAPAEPQTAQ